MKKEKNCFKKAIEENFVINFIRRKQYCNATVAQKNFQGFRAFVTENLTEL